MIRFLSRKNRAHRQPQRRECRFDHLEGRAVLSTVEGFGGTDVVLNASVPDAVGNTYVVGGFSSTVDFDPNSGVTNLTSAGGRDAVIAEYSPSGSLLWAKRFGASGNDAINDIRLDASGNLVVVGSFEGTMKLGSATVRSQGGSDGFAAKFDPAGNTIWAVRLGGAGFDKVDKLALDTAGNLYATGVFQDTASFGSTTLTSRAGSYDVFAAKFNSAGALDWVTGMGGTSTDVAGGIDLDAAGNVYVGGSFQGTAAFGGTNLTSRGGWDGFLSELSPAGVPAWTVDLGGTSNDQVWDVAVSPAGDAHAVGVYQGTASFGSNVLTSQGLSDAFAAEYGPGGVAKWATGFGGSGLDLGRSAALDAQGNLYMGGYYQNAVTGGAASVSSVGGTDGFAAKFGPTGTLLWAEGMGGTRNDTVTDIAVDGSGNLALTGSYAGQATFSAGTLPGIGSVSAFLYKRSKP